MKIDWASKLSSRKLWAAIIGFVTAILLAFSVDKLTIEQVVAIISACATLCAYIFSEGYVDAKRESATTIVNGYVEDMPTKAEVSE